MSRPPYPYCILEVTTKLEEGFVPALYRWVVERTFSWLDRPDVCAEAISKYMPVGAPNAQWMGMVWGFIFVVKSLKPTVVISVCKHLQPGAQNFGLRYLSSAKSAI